jgi:hypothetical protein
MRHIMISKLALIMLCAVPMSACGDEGAGQQPAAAKAKPASMPAAAPALDPKFLGQWEETGIEKDQEFGDMTITPDRIIFEKISAAQMTVHKDYVSLKWDDPAKALLCVGNTKVEAAVIRTRILGDINKRQGVRIYFLFKDQPPKADIDADPNVCSATIWDRPWTQAEKDEWNEWLKSIGETK